MKIGVVGLGLIGGSIFKKLEQSGYEVVGVSKSQNGVQKNISSDKNILNGCDIVFVATPMNSTLNELNELEQYVSEETIVTDCCSLKEFVSKTNYKYNFIPSHPMAGTEHSGFENSFPELFTGAKWVITPLKNEVPQVFINLIHEMGAKEIITTPEKHDMAVALISHMPLVISQALFETAEDDELALLLASSGFRDMTRLALSSETMASDMVNMNSENIQKSILKLYSKVGDLLHGKYREKIKDIKQKREKMYSDGVNILN